MYLPPTDDPAFEDLLEDYLDEVTGDEMALRIEVRLREDRPAREVLLHCLTARSLLGLALGEPDGARAPNQACAEIRSLRRRYSRGALDPAQQARLCTHLEQCSSCESHYDQPEETPGVSWKRFAAIGLAIGALGLSSTIGWGVLVGRGGGGGGLVSTPSPVAPADSGLAIIPGLPEIWDELSPLLRTSRRDEGTPGIGEVCDRLHAMGILEDVIAHPEVASHLRTLVARDSDPWVREKSGVLVAALLDEQVPQEDRIPALPAVRQLAGKRGLPFLWHLAGRAESDTFHRRVIGEITRLARRDVDREALARQCRRALESGWADSAASCLRHLNGLGDPRVVTMCEAVLGAPPSGASEYYLRAVAQAYLLSLGKSSGTGSLEEALVAIVDPLGQASLAGVLYESDPSPRWHVLVARHATDPDPRVRRVVAAHLLQREDPADRALCEMLCEDAEDGIRALAESLRGRLDAGSSRPEEEK